MGSPYASSHLRTSQQILGISCRAGGNGFSYPRTPVYGTAWPVGLWQNHDPEIDRWARVSNERSDPDFWSGCHPYARLSARRVHGVSELRLVPPSVSR